MAIQPVIMATKRRPRPCWLPLMFAPNEIRVVLFHCNKVTALRHINTDNSVFEYSCSP